MSGIYLVTVTEDLSGGYPHPMVKEGFVMPIGSDKLLSSIPDVRVEREQIGCAILDRFQSQINPPAYGRQEPSLVVTGSPASPGDKGEDHHHQHDEGMRTRNT